MTIIRKVVFFAFSFIVSYRSVYADDLTLPIAAQGNWVAFSHKQSMTDAPDLCVALGDAWFAIRADSDGVSIRLIRKEWSLPPNVQGNVTVVIDNDSEQFSVGGNENTLMDLVVPTDQVVPFLDRVETGRSMSVQVGKAKPISVSLNGSRSVVAAFRNCADIPDSTRPGSNPFK